MRPATVLTVGVFDGFHRGHVAVLETARRRADDASAALLVVTFENHPLEVLAGVRVPPLLSVGEKVRRLRAAGADQVRVLRFTPRLAARDPQAFLAEHVFPWNLLVGFVVGHDFAMGREREGTVERLNDLGRRLGFEVVSVPALVDLQGPVSSTRLRQALAAGRVDEATRLLGRAPCLHGRVVSGHGRGRKLGFPTANVAPAVPGESPAHGVYAVRLRAPGLGERPGVANFGRRPTFGEGDVAFEVHLLDGAVDLRDRTVEVELVARLRDELKFNNINELKLQIARDTERARGFLGTPPLHH